MATVVKNALVKLTDASEVTIVAAPASSKLRHVKSVTIYNPNTVAIEVTLSVKKNGVLYERKKKSIAAGGELSWNVSSDDSADCRDPFSLVATDESIVAQPSSDPTLDLTVFAMFLEES